MTNAIADQMIGRCIEQYVKTDEYAKSHTEIGVECDIFGPKRLSYMGLIVQIEFAIPGEIEIEDMRNIIRNYSAITQSSTRNLHSDNSSNAIEYNGCIVNIRIILREGARTLVVPL